MTHRAVEQYDDGTHIEVVVTEEGIIADTYRDEGLVHTGTWARTFEEMYDMIAPDEEDQYDHDGDRT